MPTPPDWRRDLEIVDDLMRRVSRETDPQKMVRMYGEGTQAIYPRDGLVSFSRRGVEPPNYRITRSSRWTEEINPWQQKDRLPLLRGGLLGEWMDGGRPVVTTDLRVPDDDPAIEHLRGARAAIVMPQYDDGVALNMVALWWRDPAMLPLHHVANMHWQANLFGRGTLNIVLRRELTQAYEALDREMQVVGDIQRSLLPETLPAIPTLDLAAHYQTSRQAGGDYYDLFALPDGKWGIFIADVSGHGTPAAVVMAITHAIVHSYPGPAMPPGAVLDYLNRTLTSRYTSRSPGFVTAFYANYDPSSRRLEYARAGHNPPRFKTARGVRPLDGVGGLPLGIMPEERYEESSITLGRGETVLFYTDGITEAFSPGRELFGEDRLDAILADHSGSASELAGRILRAVNEFTAGQPPTDDRSLLAARGV